MIQSGIVQADYDPDGSIIITTGTDGSMRIWDGDSADLVSEGFDLQRRILAGVAGPGPRRVVFTLENIPRPIVWKIPVEQRSREMLEAFSTVLSGHVIDGGEGFSPAGPEQLKAARSLLLKLDPGFFDRPGPEAANPANAATPAGRGTDQDPMPNP